MHSSSMNKIYLLLLIVAALLGSSAEAGLLSYVICQTGCNTLDATCYAASGLMFGTVTTGAGAPAVALAYNAALGLCMSACVAAGCVPIP
ncbi:hypothetical protein G6F43_010825 [Rhizopus delemar]|nr:hypothetical protein G6F43_010825 [Rhizopus delemar]